MVEQEPGHGSDPVGAWGGPVTSSVFGRAVHLPSGVALVPSTGIYVAATVPRTLTPSEVIRLHRAMCEGAARQQWSWLQLVAIRIDERLSGDGVKVRPVFTINDGGYDE